MYEFSAGGNDYRNRQLDVMTQLDVERRIAPVLTAFAMKGEMGGVVEAANTAGADAEHKVGLAFIHATAKALAAMPEQDFKFVLRTCLANLQRKEGDSWAPVISTSNGRLMYEDMDLMAMHTILAHVIKDNFANFISGVVQSGFIQTALGLS